MKSKLLRKSIICGAVSAALFCSQTVMAQEAEENETPAGELEIISVTSNKRVQSVQDVSLAVTAISAQVLKDNGVVDILSLDTLVPGMKTGVSGNDARPAMRGARTEQVEAADQRAPPPIVPGGDAAGSAPTHPGFLAREDRTKL